MSARSAIPLPSAPHGLSAIAGLAILAVAIAYAFHVVFSRSLSQDEGYLMITIQSFIEGHALYDSVFTQYGPFYYFYEWMVRTLFAVPLTHDGTRFLCIFHWLTAAAILGVAAKILMRSALAGVFVFMQAVVHLTAIASEPGHPQELVVVLVALGMLVAARKAPHIDRLGILAVITALLAFTKINVGVFFGLALLLTIRCQSQDRFSRPPWTWLLAGVCGVLPLLLMRGHLSAEWCRHFSLIAACTVTAAFVLAQSSSRPRSLELMHHLRIAASFLFPSIFFLGLVAWTGTSASGLIDGLFLTPLKMPGVALLPLPLSYAAVLNAVVSLALAVAVRQTARNQRGRRRKEAEVNVSPSANESDGTGSEQPRDSVLECGAAAPLSTRGERAGFSRPVARSESGAAAPHSKTSRISRLGGVVLVLKALFGIAGTSLLIGKAPAQFAWLLPWVWLVLVPARRDDTRASHETFPRIFLALAAAWQGLQAYPIAGTQVTTATFLLTLAFTLCLSDVLTAAQKWNPIKSMRERLARLRSGQLRLAQTLGVVALLYVFANVWCGLGDVRREYASLPPLRLPGSRFVHMDAEMAGMFRELTAYLEKECDTFVTYPGINSLYFWTGKRPPTHLNSTGWGQLSHPQQEQILSELRQARRPLLVVVAAAAQSWSQGAPPPILPLVRCVTEDCREVKRIGRFILFVPKRPEETAQGE